MCASPGASTNAVSTLEEVRNQASIAPAVQALSTGGSRPGLHHLDSSSKEQPSSVSFSACQHGLRTCTPQCCSSAVCRPLCQTCCCTSTWRHAQHPQQQLSLEPSEALWRQHKCHPAATGPGAIGLRCVCSLQQLLDRLQCDSGWQQLPPRQHFKLQELQLSNSLPSR